MFKLSKKISQIKFRQSIKLTKKNYEKFIYQNVNRLMSTHLNCQERNVVNSLSKMAQFRLELPDNENEIDIIDEMDFTENSQDYVEKILSTNGCNLKSLIIGKKCDSSILPFIKTHCPNIDNLVLDLKDYKEIDFEESLPRMENLKSIYLDCTKRCQINNEMINHIHLWLLMSLPFDIDKIVIKTDSFVNNDLKGIIYPSPYDMCATNAIDSFYSLQHLELNGFYMGINTIEAILQKKSLTHLSLIDCSCDEKFDSIFNRLSFLINLNDKFSLKNLEYLNFKNVINIDVFTCILKNSNNLKNINLTGVNTTGQFGFGKLDCLEYLNMYECHVDDDVIIDIANNCKELKHLNLTNVDLIDAIDLTELSLKEIVKLNNLVYLKIQTIHKIDDSVFLDISNNCKNLKHFEVNSIIL